MTSNQDETMTEPKPGTPLEPNASQTSQYQFPFFIVFWLKRVVRDISAYFRTADRAKAILDEFFLKRAKSSYANDTSDNVMRFVDDIGAEHVIRVDEIVNAYTMQQDACERAAAINDAIMLARQLRIAEDRRAAGLKNDFDAPRKIEASVAQTNFDGGRKEVHDFVSKTEQE